MSKIDLLKLKKIYDRIFIDQHELKFIQSVKNFNLNMLVIPIDLAKNPALIIITPCISH